MLSKGRQLPFTNLLSLHPDREDPPYAPALHPPGFLRDPLFVLLRDHLEGDLFEIARSRCRVDTVLKDTGITREVRLLVVPVSRSVAAM
jgi:hypothetical protein